MVKELKQGTHNELLNMTKCGNSNEATGQHCVNPACWTGSHVSMFCKGVGLQKYMPICLATYCLAVVQRPESAEGLLYYIVQYRNNSQCL